jgi:hypothetical protein
LIGPTTPWKSVTMANWYGDGERHVQITSNTAVWYHAGKPVATIRWVLIRDPVQRFQPQALLAANLRLTPVQILASFVRPWQTEATLEEARAHLGSRPSVNGVRRPRLGPHRRCWPSLRWCP